MAHSQISSPILPWSQDIYLDALVFAAERHGDQKTPAGFPYVTHLASVAQEVMAALAVEPGRNGTLAVTAALLHDVIEDTATSLEMVAERFGPDVLAAVMALTKNSDLPKERRMPDSLERIQAQPPEVWMVKLADRIVNLGPPPTHWTREKMAAYRAEAETILSALRDASPFLTHRLERRIAEYRFHLK
ncbi:HD domain-containing protein [Paramagnetospirillum magneticum]|uniref:Guanosine polyphosphate pyrophosphohydrolase/synthetase n=1 Tax=Paramagnetospirillum magneticum (strain ATCC 700264 / AMB-1) TaxID=342108 RepID=Q2W2F4_PARM1|nr:HD domain-containing protein [Paramagnetospirillum magneticum]BAE51971.1 Guanosine polyphosphate pyrophosphohydrolase/synthetase [Paramagnetospirillum magneticum AMB-1]